MLKSGDILNHNSEIYLSQDYILQNAGITPGYLRVAKSRFNKGTSNRWRHERIFNKDYLAYNSLPTQIQYKLLPH